MEAVQDAVVPMPATISPIVLVPKINARDYSALRSHSSATMCCPANRPVVIQDAAPGWSALQNWTPEYFKEQFGEQMVEVTYGVRQQMGEVMDGVLASTAEKPGPYLHKVIIHQHMPQLLPALSPENVYSFPRRFCSPLMPKRFHRPDGYLKLLIGGVGGQVPR